MVNYKKLTVLKFLVILLILKYRVVYIQQYSNYLDIFI